VATDLLSYRFDIETSIERDFQQMGIQLESQNDPEEPFLEAFLPRGKASLAADQDRSGQV
jgi:hypothetical protein